MDLAQQIEKMQEGQLPGHLGVKLAEVTPDKVVGTLEVRPHVCTAGDILHGGAIMALADSLGAIGAFLNLPEGARTSTVESKTNFLRPAPVGQTVTATSTLLNKGRTLMLWQTEVRNPDGKLVALVLQSQIILP